MKKHKKIKFIDCPTCESKVGAEVLSECYFNDNNSGIELMVSLLQCPVCSLPICSVGELEYTGTINDGTELGYEEKSIERVWPFPKKDFFDLPDSVRKSIEEAERCFDAKANLACSVMCRRTLEALCIDLRLSKKPLFEKLKDLKIKGFIDGRLFEWGETLRRMGNIGAHADKGSINKQDARDLLDFTIAICEYVYVLTNKYEDFKKRQKKK